MANKCLKCLTVDRAKDDDYFCRACREEAQKQRTTTGHEQPSAVPLGSTCDRHPSALAHWRASLITTRNGILEQLMCGHCHRINHQDLEHAGWIIAGAPVTCTCASCDAQGARTKDEDS